MSSLPSEAINDIKDAFDVNFYFFNIHVQEYVLWIVISLSTILTIAFMILLSNRTKLLKSHKFIAKKSE